MIDLSRIPTPTWASKCGRVALYRADCLDILPQLPDGVVDAVVTDPPYGIGKRLVSGGAGGGWHRMIASGADEWDVLPPKEVFTEVFRLSEDQIIWGGNFFDLPPCECPLCWDKVRPNQKNVSEWEYAWTSMSGRARLFSHCANGGFILAEPRKHPTQKPTPLMEWCIGLLPQKHRVFLDPFMGSGTTGVAAAQLGRDFIGVEIDTKYFDIAVNRIKAALAQGRLFDDVAPAVKAEQIEAFTE